MGKHHVSAPEKSARVLALLGLCVCLHFSFLAPAVSRADDRAIEAAREILTETENTPWYDPETDSIRPLEVEITRPAEQRREVKDNDTNKKKDKSNKKKVAEAREDVDTSTGMSVPSGGIFGSLLQAVGIVLIVALLVMILAFLLKAFLMRGNDDQAVGEAETIKGAQVDRVAQLPVAVRRSRDNLLGEAQRQYEAGNFNEAIIYLYSHQLVELDRAQHLRLAKGKTNRQYLSEIRSQSQLANVLRQTMLAFEDVFFGKYDLSRERFEGCWRRLNEFNALLQSPAVT